MDQAFWNGKKVLITGHTGFKGSWLSLWLQMLGARVLGYSLPPPTQPNLFEVARIADGMTSIIGDIRDLEYFKATVASHNPEIVIHMAAQPLVHFSYKNPAETFAVNVMGTVNLLETVRHSKSVRVVVGITSDKCYENKEWVWGYRENEPMGGKDPYSSSKGCAELVISAYRDSFFPPKKYECHRVALASARAGNVIGGGDWAKDRLVPDIMKAFMENRPAVIRHPNAVRPWQSVLNLLDGYLCLAKQLWTRGSDLSGAWNFGPNDLEAVPVSCIVERLAKVWGKGACWELEDSDDHPYEANCLRLDSTKARNVLRWAPRLRLSSALDWIVEWYLAYQRRDIMRQLTEAQIRRYQNIEA